MDTILIYYKYVTIQNPEQIRSWQREICDSLGLTGRILIATEGINGTVAGSLQEVTAYQDIMREHPLFSDIDFKTSPGTKSAFPRMRITVRRYIVNGGQTLGDVDISQTGIHLEPQQTHKLLSEQNNDVVVLDARNNYESRIGAFTGAHTPDIENFRDLPSYLDDHLEEFKNKKVVMYCTAGVRCERASAYLKSKGVAKEVYQLNGGIHRYVEQFPNGFFRGKNYVFDGRSALTVTQDVLTHCNLCPTVCDDYINCINAMCNELFIACSACKQRLSQACSQQCFDLVQSGTVIVRKQQNNIN